MNTNKIQVNNDRQCERDEFFGFKSINLMFTLTSIHEIRGLRDNALNKWSTGSKTPH